MALSTLLPANAPNSVAVHFQAGEYPRNLEETTALFSKFGDVARLDTTLGPVTGLVFVTFFDVRCALKVLSDFKGRAEPFPPAAHDFRAVSILTSVLSTLPASFTGFQSFGEIAGVSVQGENMVVEFYDIRAAQQVTYSLPASRPRRSLPSTPPDHSSPPELLRHPATEPFKETRHEHVQLKAKSNDLSQSLAGFKGMLPEFQPSFSEALPNHRRAGTNGHAAQGKPVREKVRTQDLLKFDIVPEKIRAGEDPRTTVMVRNIPKACTREAFVQLLVPCGLEDRYTFFYMPFDKRRNIHCGFAFINFRTPMDVLTLFEKMTSTLWRCLAPSQNARAEKPAVSYARLQGQDQLMKHFSLSAVMHDSDARKRPMFCEEEQQQFDIEEKLEELMNDDAVRDAVLKAAEQPRYVSIGHGMKDIENPWAEDGHYASDSLAFLMSHHSGA